jgi:hypothetical protein
MERPPSCFGEGLGMEGSSPAPRQYRSLSRVAVLREVKSFCTRSKIVNQFATCCPAKFA